ncbi:MAG: hypothetical protein EA405_13665 [Rhodospirillales bacterium]|nr:MAG: hypothetical protein EA405_13665 [Rhodospirillales bacterium]
MGGIARGLFGSKGKAGTPAQVVDTTPDEFVGLRGPVADALSGLISSGGGPQFQGPFAAPMTGNEQTLLQQAFGQTVNAPGTDAASQFLTQVLGGQFLTPDSNPFLQQAIQAAQRPVLEQFQDAVMPRLQAQFTRAGQFTQPQASSPFDMAAALSSRGLANALGDISTNMSFGNFQAERGRQQEAAQLLPAIESEQLDRTMRGLQAQALPRMIQELGIERGMQEFQRRVDVLLTAIAQAGTLAQAQPATLPGTPGTAGSPGFLPAFLAAGARAGGEALGAKLFG